jgi:hypothetical protein
MTIDFNKLDEADIEYIRYCLEINPSLTKLIKEKIIILSTLSPIKIKIIDDLLSRYCRDIFPESSDKADSLKEFFLYLRIIGTSKNRELIEFLSNAISPGDIIAEILSKKIFARKDPNFSFRDFAFFAMGNGASKITAELSMQSSGFSFGGDSDCAPSRYSSLLEYIEGFGEFSKGLYVMEDGLKVLIISIGASIFSELRRNLSGISYPDGDFFIDAEDEEIKTALTIYNISNIFYVYDRKLMNTRFIALSQITDQIFYEFNLKRALLLDVDYLDVVDHVFSRYRFQNKHEYFSLWQKAREYVFVEEHPGKKFYDLFCSNFFIPIDALRKKGVVYLGSFIFSNLRDVGEFGAALNDVFYYKVLYKKGSIMQDWKDYGFGIDFKDDPEKSSNGLESGYFMVKVFNPYDAINNFELMIERVMLSARSAGALEDFIFKSHEAIEFSSITKLTKDIFHNYESLKKATSLDVDLKLIIIRTLDNHSFPEDIRPYIYSLFCENGVFKYLQKSFASIEGGVVIDPSYFGDVAKKMEKIFLFEKLQKTLMEGFGLEKMPSTFTLKDFKDSEFTVCRITNEFLIEYLLERKDLFVFLNFRGKSFVVTNGDFKSIARELDLLNEVCRQYNEDEKPKESEKMLERRRLEQEVAARQELEIAERGLVSLRRKEVKVSGENLAKIVEQENKALLKLITEKLESYGCVVFKDGMVDPKGNMGFRRYLKDQEFFEGLFSFPSKGSKFKINKSAISKDLVSKFLDLNYSKPSKSEDSAPAGAGSGVVKSELYELIDIAKNHIRNDVRVKNISHILSFMANKTKDLGNLFLYGSSVWMNDGRLPPDVDLNLILNEDIDLTGVCSKEWLVKNVFDNKIKAEEITSFFRVYDPWPRCPDSKVVAISMKYKNIDFTISNYIYEQTEANWVSGLDAVRICLNDSEIYYRESFARYCEEELDIDLDFIDLSNYQQSPISHIVNPRAENCFLRLIYQFGKIFNKHFAFYDPLYEGSDFEESIIEKTYDELKKSYYSESPESPCFGMAFLKLNDFIRSHDLGIENENAFKKILCYLMMSVLTNEGAKSSKFEEFNAEFREGGVFYSISSKAPKSEVLEPSFFKVSERFTSASLYQQTTP